MICFSLVSALYFVRPHDPVSGIGTGKTITVVHRSKLLFIDPLSTERPFFKVDRGTLCIRSGVDKSQLLHI